MKSIIDYGICVIRSSHQRCSIKKGALRNFAKFTGKHLCQSLFFNKVVNFKVATLLKKRLWHRCLPVNFTKFLRTPFLQNAVGRLLLCNETFLMLIALKLLNRWFIRLKVTYSKQRYNHNFSKYFFEISERIILIVNDGSDLAQISHRNTSKIINEYNQSSVSNSIDNYLNGNISDNKEPILFSEKSEALDLLRSLK